MIPAIASIPVSNSVVRASFKDSINKKASGAVLTGLEKFRHAARMVAYPNYKAYYDEKMSRIHTFSDGIAKLIDTTPEGRFKIVKAVRDYFSVRIMDFITYRGDRIHWLNERGGAASRHFSREAGTDFVIVKSGPKKESFQIKEKDNTWRLDTIFPNQIPGSIQIAPGLYLPGTGFLEYHTAVDIQPRPPADPVTQAVVASFPVDSSALPEEQRTLIDKKVSGVAMTASEEEQHLQLLSNELYNTVFKTKLARVHYCGDDVAALYDCTKNGIGSIQLDERMRREYIALNGIKIVLWPHDDHNCQLTFYRRPPGHTNYVVLRDASQENCVETIEYETKRPELAEPETHTRIVDLSQPKKVQFASTCQCCPTYAADIYVAKKPTVG